MDTGEGSDALMRGQDDTDPGKDGVQKLSQVVQVSGAAALSPMLAYEVVRITLPKRRISFYTPGYHYRLRITRGQMSNASING